MLQNLRFFAGIYGLTGRDRDREIDGMVDAFHFAPYLKANAGDLPLGIRQRLALACAVMHKPAVLFLDEPTSGVSPVTRIVQSKRLYDRNRAKQVDRRDEDR